MAVEVESGESSVCVLDGINHSNWDPDLRLRRQVVLLSLHQKLWPPLQHKEILQQKKIE